MPEVITIIIPHVKMVSGDWLTKVCDAVELTRAKPCCAHLMHQSIESPGGGGRDGAGIVHRPSALFCIVPAPRGTFFCH